jgi:hypothetical protein
MNADGRCNPWGRVSRSAGAIALAVALLGVATVSSASAAAGGRSAAARPSGPKAQLTKLTGGDGVFIGEGAAPDLERMGYRQREYTAEGTATSYRPSGALTSDGRWRFAPDASAPYRTRVLVRAPAKAADFSGVVVVEWLNVSGGVDANAEWASTQEEIVRAGDAWVGVSAQRIGVEGGPTVVKVEGPGSEAQGKGLKAIDPERYGALEHPGDGFSFDIYTQIADAVRDGAGLKGRKPRRLIAAGESQSAFALVTYYNGVQPLTRAFDGFFVHSRAAAGLVLVGPGQYADIGGSLGGTTTIFRTDQVAPVMNVQTETDVSSILNSYAARQPDNKRFRLWEVVGAAHADAHLIGSAGADLDCGVPINDGPMHIVAKAALRALTAWLETGTAPVKAPRIEIAPGATPEVVRDANGIAQGGVRTPPVDVPVAALSGAPGPNPSTICLLLGSTKPFTAAQIRALYPSRQQYLKRYRADTVATITSGFALPADRAALLAYADPSAIQG